MISKKDIISMARKVTHRSHGYTERKAMHPRREWFIGVSLFILVAVTGGVFNAQTYVYYNTLEHTITDTTTPIKKYKDQAAKEAQSIYSERTVAFNALANTAPAVVVVSTSTASTSDDIADSETEDSEEVVESVDETSTSSADSLLRDESTSDTE